jgi:hypothetical protein
MADSVTDTLVVEIPNAKVRAIAMRVARQAELGFEKVAAHHAEPARFPLPTQAGSLEQILAIRFDKLPESTKKVAGARATARLKASAANRQRRFKDLASINLAKPIEAQVKALPFPAELKFSSDELRALTTMDGQSATAAAAATPTTNRLELRIHKVRCVDETGSGFLGELGDDEIDLGGTTVDQSGITRKIPAFRVGSSFDDGEEVSFSPPRRFALFDLNQGKTFPKSYFATLVLAEIDMGGLPDFVNKLYDWIKAKVTEEVTKAGGPIGIILPLVVAYVADLVFDYFGKLWGDDVFEPGTVSVRIPSLTARWAGGATDGPEQTLTFKGHGGTYQIVYDWRLFAA